MASRLVPLNNMVVLKAVVQEEVLASGLVIPDTAKERPQQGEVIAVGPGRIDESGKRVPIDIAPGDRVLFRKYASSQEVKIDNQDLLVLKEEDILCKVQV